jgi:hypothetical protein
LIFVCAGSKARVAIITALFFLAIGRDEAEIESAIADARASFTLHLNDLIVRLDHALAARKRDLHPTRC